MIHRAQRSPLLSVLRDKPNHTADNIELSRAVVVDIIRHLDRDPKAMSGVYLPAPFRVAVSAVLDIYKWLEASYRS
jgi:hypothetical protein